MKLSLNPDITRNFGEVIRREWIETNGLGGWASSTVSGANTRRYHGLLVAALRPPVGRMVLLSKLDEVVHIDGRRYELGCNLFSGTVHPQGYNYLAFFEKDLWPVFVYRVDEVLIRRSVLAVYGENSTLVFYEVLEAPSAVVLDLQPFVAARDYHALVKANASIRTDHYFRDGVFSVRPYNGAPEIYIGASGAEFEFKPDWYYRFEYPAEQLRGQDFQEDLFTHGTFRRRLYPGDRFAVIVSTRDPAGRDPYEIMEQERQRRLSLVDRYGETDGFIRLLSLAADQFVARRGKGLRTIIAGYHWFTDWGRDTMIALPGLALATGRFEDARRVLEAFASSTCQGILPNRFPDAGEEPEYNTVDATLWFFVAVYKYLQYTGDTAFVASRLIPKLGEIIGWHERGTRYGIREEKDGLLSAGEPGVQLTWMDAKIGEWVVTPRQGKAVEINALWYNALCIFAELLQGTGSSGKAETYRRKAARVKNSFEEVFWYDAGGYLYDVVEDDRKDASMRPNQIFAVSLPFQVIEGEKAAKVLSAVTENLYTPFGLRSLSPNDPDYRSSYAGDPVSRDSAYHQGTVWAWLLGPYLTALVRVRGETGRTEARQCIESIKSHLLEAGIGTVSEIFDGDPPHAPRGCIAQAWSVGEILRAYLEDIEARVYKTQQTGPSRKAS